MTRLLAGAALAALALSTAACSRNQTAEAPTPPPAESSAAPTPAEKPPVFGGAAPAVGGDGSDIVLSALSQAEIAEAKLPGELGCSFSNEQGLSLLVAKGDVGTGEPAQGVVKVGDYVERIGAPGGFNAMAKGVTFSGAGKTIPIELTGPATAGGESPPRPATLTYQRADGASRMFNGLWTCGP